MKYEYEGISKGNIVNNYKKENGKIVITFLDGSTHTITLSEESEKKILDLMIKQAENRNNNKDTRVSKLKLKKADYVISGIILSTLNTINTIKSLKNRKTEDRKIVNIATIASLVGLTGIRISLAKKDIDLANEELDDIKKYSLYLENKEKIEKCKNDPNLYPNLHEDIKNKGKLDINTLDNYTLKDMLTVIKNLPDDETLEYKSKSL